MTGLARRAPSFSAGLMAVRLEHHLASARRVEFSVVELTDRPKDETIRPLSMDHGHDH
jgi:hypothetical protein